MRTLVLATAAACLGVVLAGCGGGTKTVVQTTTVVRTTTVTVTHASTTAPATTTETANACSGDSMSGTFAVVPGSAGAGTIVYTLRVKNESPVACFVSGFPKVQLLGQGGTELPTQETPEQPGAGTAARIVLAPGASASADVRFSPDVPGTGDQTGPQCEPKATMLRVALGGAPLDVAVSPPTPVCERGTLQYRAFAPTS